MNENELEMTDNLFPDIEQDIPLNPVIHVKWLFKNGTQAYLSSRTANHIKFGLMEWCHWLCSIRDVLKKNDEEGEKTIMPFLTFDIHDDPYVIAMEEVDWVEVTDGKGKFTFMF